MWIAAPYNRLCRLSPCRSSASNYKFLDASERKPPALRTACTALPVGQSEVSKVNKTEMVLQTAPFIALLKRPSTTTRHVSDKRQHTYDTRQARIKYFETINFVRGSTVNVQDCFSELVNTASHDRLMSGTPMGARSRRTNASCVSIDDDPSCPSAHPQPESRIFEVV